MRLAAARVLPDDGCAGTLVGRIWSPGERPGPSVAAIRDDGVFDLSADFATMSTLLDADDPVRAARRRPRCGREWSLADILDLCSPGSAGLLAPCDLQVVKASGVTFAASLIERVIEERARGDAARAERSARGAAAIGDALRRSSPARRRRRR